MFLVSIGFARRFSGGPGASVISCALRNAIWSDTSSMCYLRMLLARAMIVT